MKRKKNQKQSCCKNERSGFGMFTWLGALAAFFIVVLAGIGGAAVYVRNEKRRKEEQRQAEQLRRRKREESERQAEQVRKQREEERKEKEKLADAYCEILQEIENLKAEEVYRNTFLRYARVYQVLFGLERRYEMEGMSETVFLDEIDVEFNNSRILKQLSSEGFAVQVNPEAIDKEAYKDECLSLDVKLLAGELKKEEKNLAHYQSLLSCKDYIEKTGKDLFSLKQMVSYGKMKECLSIISVIHKTLEECGCFAVFADDARIIRNAYLKADFLDDLPGATELPGLYIKNNRGELLLIGNCGGTKRVSK